MPSSTECDIYARDSHGRVTDRVRRDYANRDLLHRVWSELHGKPWPTGMIICHTCDEHRCSNPEHIFPGTYQDNAKDMYNKGRAAGAIHGAGERHRFAKLTQAQVDEIKLRKAAGETLSSMEKEYGVGASQLSRIVNGKRWNGVPRAVATT